MYAAMHVAKNDSHSPFHYIDWSYLVEANQHNPTHSSLTQGCLGGCLGLPSSGKRTHCRNAGLALPSLSVASLDVSAVASASFAFEQTVDVAAASSFAGNASEAVAVVAA
jgi:hypothetical protein